MTEFLAENNACGQNLLRIVSMGNSIIAEILRLKDYIPEVLRLKTKTEQQKYKDIIMDFSYLRAAEAYDKKIEDDPNLQNLDDEFRDNFLDLLVRFYSAFESTHQYAFDLQHFLEELNRGYYIQQTIESVLQDLEGKQLMCEALFLFGVMLIVIDLHIPGIIRERLLILYYRYSASQSHGGSKIDDVCMLFRSTGYSSEVNAKRIPNYPENYFSRFTFDHTFVDMVIGRLRSDDIYNQISIYPHPDHRSTALSNQAGMLFVCLYFSPKILHNQLSQMREISDKFFSDNWVVPVYMGITVNLIDAWDHFKAAKSALNSIIEPLALKNPCDRFKDSLKKDLHESYEMLQDGTLTENFVLQNITKIMNLIRNCNVTLRWFFLHTSLPVLEFGGVKKVKQVLDHITLETDFKSSQLFELLLNASQLELIVKNILKELITEKNKRWDLFKKESLDRINELSEVFSGARPLSKIEKNQNLNLWFTEIAKEISNLSVDSPIISGHKIIQLIQAVEEVQEFHNLHSNMQVKQYLLETRGYLHSMVQVINVKEDVLINIQLISDLSYAWHIIDSNYTDIMQASIKKLPKLVIKLRASFLKLASALELPLLRINQAKSEDLISVSKYYSNELANYIRKVVQIIPMTMFTILSKIIQLQTEVITEIPTRLEKDKLKEYAQFDDRYTVARLTYSISVFTEGILMMKKTLVGVIELDPKQLLEDGIRKELVMNLANALNVGLVFSAKSKTPELESKLIALFKVIDGYKRSFEYIQDYLNVHGLKILQEELSRIIKFNVERECNKFQRNKIQDWQSSYQSTTIPIPIFAPVQGDTISDNFIGRLAREILQTTEPKNTIYLDLKSSWYDKKTQKEIFDARLFTKIREAIGPAGLVGLDKLYTHMFIPELEVNIGKIQKKISNDKSWLDMLNTLAGELKNNRIIHNPVKFFSNWTTRLAKIWPTIIDWILELGHKQLLRQNIANDLNKSSKFNSKNLESSVNTFNKSLLSELTEFNENLTPENNQIIFALNEYLEFCGNYDPLQQIFVITKNSHYISLFMFLFTISHIPKLQFSKNVNCLFAKSSKDLVDGYPIVIGIITILRQFHPDVTELYLEYLGQYVSSFVDASLSNKQEVSIEVQNFIRYLEMFLRSAKIQRSVLEKYLPEILLNQIDYLSASKA